MSEEDKWKRFRMDFVQEPVAVPHLVEVDEDHVDAVEMDGKYYIIDHMELEFRAKPHPDRYERIEDPPGWLDKFDDTIIPDDVLEPALDELEKPILDEDPDNDLPRYYDPPQIDDTVEYVEARKEEIRLAVEDEKPLHMVEPDRQTLSELESEDVQYFAIMSIDLVRSTSLSIGMGNDRFAKMIQIYMMETANLIHNFNGSILSTGGDGIIAYFPGPNVNGMHDNTIDCAVSHMLLLRDGINEVLQSAGFPELKCRIGINSGTPGIVSEGEEDYNLLGVCVNLASKIQQEADPGEILLGETTERNLHTRWRTNTSKVTEEKNWNIKIGGRVYDIYRYNYIETENN
ncbi:adenylate/guanylate cyclase domain-containing protein [Halorubrum sp. DTA46]|uniref:adenylate/guanylate cyclase domain-containing protein n=1 Tax=Halorubrum sp. DTA46 TaxID=3402162 RepID=UPI003AACDA9C